MNSTTRNKKSVLASKLLVAVAAGALALMAPAVMAQQHGGGGKGGGGGHDGGAGTSHTSGDDGHSSHDSGGGGKGGKKGGQEAGRGKGSGGSSLRDVFREMEDEAAAEKGKKGPPQGKGPSAEKVKGSDQAKKGKKPDAAVAEEEDSDRPEWAGKDATKPDHKSTESGTKKGDIYGDLYIIERNPDGTPVLDDDGYVKVLFKDASGEFICCIDRDEEGNLLTTGTTVDGTVVSGVLPVEVELGRLSVGRSPTRVLSAQLDEAIKSIDAATEISFDASGRIVLTTADGDKTIDSPLENLALYLELINTGTIATSGDVDATTLAALESLNIKDDGVLSPEELKIASSLYAAASDKTIPITIDSIIYMNTILGVDPLKELENADGYVDYSSFTYNREDVYGDLEVKILVTEDGGETWVTKTVNVYDTVFDSNDPDTEGDNLVASNVEGFTAAADDARTVINFIHEYSVPVAPTTN